MTRPTLVKSLRMCVIGSMMLGCGDSDAKQDRCRDDAADAECGDSDTHEEDVHEEDGAHEEDGGESDTTPDADTEDSGPGETDGGPEPEAIEVCNDTWEGPGLQPQEGVTTVLPLFDLDEGQFIELDGPSRIIVYGVGGCTFHAAPGHYDVRIVDDGGAQDWAEVDLAADQTVALAVHGSDADPRALVVPVDVSVPDTGFWRGIFINLARDNVEGEIDIYTYDPAINTPQGSPKLLAGGLSFGDVATVDVPPRSLVYEFQPTGTAPDGLYFGELADCNTAKLAFIQAIWCDTAEVFDDAEGPCYARSGGNWMVFNLGGESCL